jgi:redox-regulated HSP33 family molecular chaperone
MLQMLDEQEKDGKARELDIRCRFCGKKYSYPEDVLMDMAK